MRGNACLCQGWAEHACTCAPHWSLPLPPTDMPFPDGHGVVVPSQRLGDGGGVQR